MATGRNNATIATTLFMSERAVEKHIGAVFQKLGLVDEHVTNRRVMAVLAYLEASGPTDETAATCTGVGQVGRSSSSVSVGFVLGVYVLVVLGGGVLIGRTDSPSPALSVLATTVVALAFAPVQAWLERAAARRDRDAVRRPGPVRRDA